MNKVKNLAMSFKKVKSQEEMDALLAEFLINRSQVKAKSTAESAGFKTALTQKEKTFEELAKAIEKEKKDPLGESLENIAKELKKQNLGDGTVEQIINRLMKNSVNTTTLMANFVNQMRDLGATFEDVLQLVVNLSSEMDIPATKTALETHMFNLEQQIQDSQNKIQLLDNRFEKANENNNIQQMESISELIRSEETKIKEVMKLHSLTKFKLDSIIRSEEKINVVEIDPELEIEREKLKKELEETKKILEPLPGFQALNIEESDNNIFVIFPGQDFERKIKFDKDNKTIGVRGTKSKIKRLFELRSKKGFNQIQKVLKNNPSNVDKYNEIKSYLESDDGKFSNDTYQKFQDILSALGIDQAEELMPEIRDNPWYKTLLKKTNKKQGLGIKLGGQVKRHPYKILNVDTGIGRFGNLIIDTDALASVLHLKAYKDDRLVVDEKIDIDTFDLLTKRFNPKRKYSDKAVRIFKKMVDISDIGFAPTSGKFELLDEEQRRGIKPHNVNENGRMKIRGGRKKIQAQTADQMIERLGLITASIEAGNDSSQLKNELMDIIDNLMKKEIINRDQHKTIFDKYISL